MRDGSLLESWERGGGEVGMVRERREEGREGGGEGDKDGEREGERRGRGGDEGEGQREGDEGRREGEREGDKESDREGEKGAVTWRNLGLSSIGEAKEKFELELFTFCSAFKR